VGPPNKQTNYEPIYKLPKTPEENSDNGRKGKEYGEPQKDRHSVWQSVSVWVDDAACPQGEIRSTPPTSRQKPLTK